MLFVLNYAGCIARQGSIDRRTERAPTIDPGGNRGKQEEEEKDEAEEKMKKKMVIMMKEEEKEQESENE